MFILISGGPDETVFSKYFDSYENAENKLLDNGFLKSEDLFNCITYKKTGWNNEFKLDDEHFGFQCYIQELKKY